MDKISQYEQIICDILQKYANFRASDAVLKSFLIIDKERKQYQLLSVGWKNEKYIYTIAFHLSILNEKIWIHQNNTESQIADELCELGVQKMDIVLGFISEKARVYTGFAVE
ncbi:MAG: XisI protein [Bacteroidetes bacterium]|nr:MAG: XisI protein [Bacteroidota bacterium]